MRKRCESALSAFVAIAFLAGAAHAQCDFSPGTGTRLRVPMVRAFEECFYINPSETTSNTTTVASMPACSPVAPAPRFYTCAETGNSCSFGSGSCPQWICGDYVDPYADYLACATNSDCPPPSSFPPFSNGVCENHPGNVCQGEAGTRSVAYSFAPGGSCTLSASSKVEHDCSRLTNAAGATLGLPSGACHVTTLKARCRKILDGSGSPLDATENGWELRTLTRATFDDVSGDMTQIDFPVAFAFGDPDRGSIELATNTAEALVPILGTAGAALPACTHLQPVDVRVADPDGNIFAKVGLATQP